MLKVRYRKVYSPKNWYDTNEDGTLSVETMDDLTQIMADWGYHFCRWFRKSIIFKKDEFHRVEVREILDGSTVIYSNGEDTPSHAHLGARAERYIEELRNPTIVYGD